MREVSSNGCGGPNPSTVVVFSVPPKMSTRASVYDGGGGCAPEEPVSEDERGENESVYAPVCVCVRACVHACVCMHVQFSTTD